VRNRWAHHAAFDDADTYRALDTTVRLLDSLSAESEAEEVTDLRRQFQARMTPTADAGSADGPAANTSAPTAGETDTAAAASAGAPAPSTATLHVSSSSIVSHAMAHNRISVVHGVRIEHHGVDVRDARLTIEVSAAGVSLGEPREHFFDLVHGATNERTDIQFKLDPSLMAEVESNRPAEVRVTPRDGTTVLAQERVEVQLLAGAHWFYDGNQLTEELLAAHVQPNHPALASLVDEAATILGERTGRASFTGYQEADPERVDATVDAIVTAFRRRGVRYSMPPAGWGRARRPASSRAVPDFDHDGNRRVRSSSFVMTSTVRARPGSSLRRT
jgi:hypothetical protein